MFMLFFTAAWIFFLVVFPIMLIQKGFFGKFANTSWNQMFMPVYVVAGLVVGFFVFMILGGISLKLLQWIIRG